MTNGRGSRILPILAAVLVFTALAVALTLLIIRIPQNLRFQDSLVASQFALEEGSESTLRRELLRSSRYAVSASNWKALLSIAAEAAADNGRKSDYKLVATLAGRATASVPGDEVFRASWAWGLLRAGNEEDALEVAEQLRSAQWSSLRAEIRLKAKVGPDGGALSDYLVGMESRPDAEYLDMAAALTESAELTLDAALLYMRSGRPEQAFPLAEAIMNGDRRWNDPDTATRMGVAQALASIAQDNSRNETAILWLSDRVDENRRRRAQSWENLQMLGDLHWDRYIHTGDESYRDSASDAWREAMDLVSISRDDALPTGAWRLWVNQAVLEESAGRIRESRRLLEEALVLYPSEHEVKAAWAVEMRNDEPALARRMARSAYEESNNPVLGVTVLRLDPDSISPRLYEARLWALFEAVTDPNSRLHDTDGRTIATFLLNYMSSRKNFSSVDVAVDRYRKAFPEESWILPWRLAADAARGLAMLDLVPSGAGGTSPYEEMRQYAISGSSWRALHDSALYAMIAADELMSARGRYIASIPDSRPVSDISVESVILSIIEPQARRSHIENTPLADRFNRLVKERDDLQDERNTLSSTGRKGTAYRAGAAVALDESARGLREDALDALKRAHDTAASLDGTERASLLYLESLILRKMNLIEESRRRASEALDADPQHARAREILTLEETS